MDFGKISKSAGNLFGKIDFDALNLNDLKLDEVLSDEFIKNNTSLSSLKTFIEKSGFNVNSIADFKNLPVDKLDDFIKSISSFGSWKKMLEKAVAVKFGGSV